MKLRNLFTVIIALTSIYAGWYIGFRVRLTPFQQIMAAANTPVVMSTSEHVLRIRMRKLWMDDVIWVRMYTQDLLTGSPSVVADRSRLSQIQEDIGQLFGEYYGDEAGRQLSILLGTNINQSKDVIQAIRDGDLKSLEKANTGWYDSGYALASMLSHLSPQWTEIQMRTLVKEYLDLTKRQAVDIQDRQYVSSIEDFDKVSDHALRLADTFSDGIVAQFPGKF